MAGFAQIDPGNSHATPKGGMAAVALVYYKIDFSKEERAHLRTHEAELIFGVSETGVAKLEKVNGIGILSIIDSMKRVDHKLPLFNPEMIDGVAQPTVFFMMIQWPHYQDRTYAPYPGAYTNIVGLKREMFETIELASRFDMIIGGAATNFSGSAGNYLKTGGGVRMDLIFSGRSGWGGGLTMDVTGNAARKEYPIATQYQQSRSLSTLFIGLLGSKVISDNQRGLMQLQAQLCFATHNIVTVDPGLKNKPVQASGFSPALVWSYALPIGQGRMSQYYFSPVFVKNYIEFHAAIRPVFYDVKSANGVCLEAGLSWRLAMIQVRSFKLRE